jgi:tRNA (guanine6-N2)-methyltransferase
VRRTPGSGRDHSSPPANNSRAPDGRRFRRDDRLKGSASAAKPFKSFKSPKPGKIENFVKSEGSGKPGILAKPDLREQRGRVEKSDKAANTPRFDRRKKSADPAKSNKFNKFIRFDRRDKGVSFARIGRPALPAERATAQPSGPALHLTSNIYIAHTQPGFEDVAAEEIASRYGTLAGRAGRGGGGPAMRELGRRLMPERAGMTIFSAPRPDPLGTARTIEDLFALVGYRDGLGTAPAALEKIRAAAHEAPYVEEALEARVRMTPGSRAGRKLGFRVIARIADEHEFRRIDFQRAVERGIADRGDHSWRMAGDDADVEFWATLLGAEMFLTVRLVDERMRHREYKVAHRPGSLRASVAAALGWLSHPGPDDSVVDPMCGAGTILIERAHLGRYAMLAGFDRDPGAIAAAHENIGPRYRPIGLAQGDGLRLPLGKGAATHLVTNLPWGTRYGSHGENRRLYPRLIEEFARVVRPGGRLVMLTAERMLMREVASRGFVRVESVKRVMILGAPAVIYLCRT